MPRSVRIVLVAAIAAALGLLYSVWLLKPADIGISSGTMLPQPKAIPAFSLVDSQGAAFTNVNLVGHHSLIFIGFTHCPDVCPSTLTLLKNVRKELGSDAKKLQIVFLSIDPERDTPAQLNKYIQGFGEGFTAVTGGTSALETLGMSLSYVFVKVPGETPETYTMDHSTALILVNPQGQLAGFFTAPHQGKALVTDLKKTL